MIDAASQIMRNVGGTLFAMQLGQVVGQLSTEVVSGGDIGIPLLDEGAALLPQNVLAFGADLDIPVDQVHLYLAVRELAHARLFRHAKWLRLQLHVVDHRVRPGHPHRHRPAAGTRRRLRPGQPRRAARGDDQRRPHPAEDRRTACRARPARNDARAHRGLGGCRHRRRDDTPAEERCDRGDGQATSRIRWPRRVRVRDARGARASPAPPSRGRRHVAGGNGCGRAPRSATPCGPSPTSSRPATTSTSPTLLIARMTGEAERPTTSTRRSKTS